MPPSSSVGFDAGWRLEFRRDDPSASAGKPVVAVDRAGYDAEVRAEFDATWRAPTFTVTVEGLRQTDYDAIVSGPCPLITLAMGWRDTPGSLLAVGANLLAATGLAGARTGALPTVLTGRVTAAERTAGDVRYRTTFTGVDAAWARLQATRVDAAKLPKKGSVVDYLRALCALASPTVEVVAEGFHPTLDGAIDLGPRDSVWDAVTALARAVFPDSPQGRVPLLMRSGKMHVGVWKETVTGGARHSMDASGGLVEVSPAPYEHIAPTKQNPYAPATADAWLVTLLGHPDIQVGDLISLAVPEGVGSTGGGLADALGLLGPVGVLAAPVAGLIAGASEVKPRDFRVVSVTHVLGRSIGFTTRLRVEGVGKGPDQAGPHGEAHRVAEDIDARLSRVARSRRAVDVGVVTSQSLTASADRHPQRLDLDDGLAERPPPNIAVTGSLADPATALVDKPYLTPFAYGATGLVVPHYPGTRVVHLNHEGDPRNAVVAGCVWPQGSEPDSQPGDWWLTLPTGVSPAKSGTSATPKPQGSVSSDLVNASGGRVLNVLGFEITVGKSLMPDVGKRPDDPAAEVLLIRSDNGKASISIDKDGNVTISTEKEIRFSAKKVVMDVQDGVEVT